MLNKVATFQVVTSSDGQERAGGGMRGGATESVTDEDGNVEADAE
jgi:hypothetical protein